MANRVSIAGIVLVLVGCRAATGDAGVLAAPRIETHLTYVDDADTPLWRVELVGEGLRGAMPPVLQLQNWGEWLRIDDYYLRGLVAEPPLRRRDERNAFDVLAPDDWDGELRVRYELPVIDVSANAREAFGLLPWRTPSYSFGFAANTLFAVDASDELPTPERWIEITAPADWLVASGFAAPALGRLRTRVPESFGNTAIAFGRPLARAEFVAGGVPVHVVQFGGERSVAEPLADFARRYLAACIRSLGAPRSPELSLIVTEPGLGGTRTDGVIAIGCPDGLGGFDGAASPWTLHFLAHELFHDWLGGRLKSTEGERLAWFWEGFTDYLSLWHLTELGLVSRDWFAERLLDYEVELRDNPRWGAAAFADRTLDWRDPALEPLAYKGSALTAFALDVALREAGKPGLEALLVALSAENEGRYELDSLRKWLAAEGLETFWNEQFVAASRVEPGPLLLRIGYEKSSRARALAYVGVRLDRDGPFGTVVAVDPQGPSTGTVLIGDRVSGLTPTRTALPGAEAAAPDYPFGLAHYELAERVRIDVERGDEHLQLWVEPRTLEGASIESLRASPSLDAFFR